MKNLFLAAAALAAFAAPTVADTYTTLTSVSQAQFLVLSCHISGHVTDAQYLAADDAYWAFIDVVEPSMPVRNFNSALLSGTMHGQATEQLWLTDALGDGGEAHVAKTCAWAVDYNAITNR